MIGSITTLLAGVRVHGSVYRVDHAPDGPSSPIWLTDDAAEYAVCACCGEALIDFEEPENDGEHCRACGGELGPEDDVYCSQDCADDYLFHLSY